MQKQQKSHTTFSLIIPMKNAEKYIEHALNSIAMQEYEDVEVLVIDDNSDSRDNSKAIVENWRQKHPEITIKTFETQDGHRGPGGARNVGLDNASGQYILFLDADDQLNENALLSIREATKNNPSTDIFVLGYQLTRLDSNENKVSNMRLPAGKIQESRFFQIGANTAGSIWNNCIRKSLFDGRNGRNQIRFKENCIFEDFPTKVELFLRNQTRIKSVHSITHTQFSRPCTSLTGNLTIRDLQRLIEAHREIVNLKSQAKGMDKIYISARSVTQLGAIAWCISKSMRNKWDRIKAGNKREEGMELAD